MKLRLLVLPLVAGVAAFSNASNLLSNGGFDTYTGPAFSNYTTLFNGDTSVTDWTVGLHSVDLVTSNYINISLPYAIDLAGTPGPGSISQTISVPNGYYAVSFEGTSLFTGDLGTVVATFGATTHSFVMTGSIQTYSFIAPASGSSTLTLSTTLNNTTNGNIFVDNASVQAVPEPTTMAALGLGALGFLKRRRKA